MESRAWTYLNFCHSLKGLETAAGAARWALPRVLRGKASGALKGRQSLPRPSQAHDSMEGMSPPRASPEAQPSAVSMAPTGPDGARQRTWHSVRLSRPPLRENP